MCSCLRIFSRSNKNQDDGQVPFLLSDPTNSLRKPWHKHLNEANKQTSLCEPPLVVTKSRQVLFLSPQSWSMCHPNHYSTPTAHRAQENESWLLYLLKGWRRSMELSKMRNGVKRSSIMYSEWLRDKLGGEACWSKSLKKTHKRRVHCWHIGALSRSTVNMKDAEKHRATTLSCKNLHWTS